MKFVRDFLRVFAVILAVGAFVLFFFPFVNVVFNGIETTLNGAQLAFGSELAELGSASMQTFKSGYYFGSIILTALTALLMVLGLFGKKEGNNVAALILGVINAILVIVFAANRPEAYVDMGRVAGAELSYTLFFTIAVIAVVASVVFCVAGILVKDAIRAKETGSLTIPQKVLKFLREYKSELKKVVWPNGRSVVKNTLVVLAVCAVALLIIWLVDLGLGELFKLCFGA